MIGASAGQPNDRKESIMTQAHTAFLFLGLAGTILR